MCRVRPQEGPTGASRERRHKHSGTSDTQEEGMQISTIYVTVLRKNGLIAGLAKIDFFPEMASTKLRYCLSKI